MKHVYKKTIDFIIVLGGHPFLFLPRRCSVDVVLSEVGPRLDSLHVGKNVAPAAPWQTDEIDAKPLWVKVPHSGYAKNC